MLRNYSIVTLALLLLACFTYTRFLNGQLSASRANERVIALKASNIEAMHDTTHDLGLIGDTVRAFARRVVQQAQSVDHPAQYVTGVAVRQMDTTVVARGRDTIPFHIRDEPFTIDALLSRQLNDDSAALALHVVVDTIHLVARIECSPGTEAGIRAASIMTTAPPWANIRFGAVQQTPEVCNPVQAEKISRRSFLSWAPVAVSVGRQIGSGAKGWSAQIGTAITFGAR
jgi:hypothetical protein